MEIEERDIVQIITDKVSEYRDLYVELRCWIKYRRRLLKLEPKLESMDWIITIGGKVYKKAYYEPFEDVKQEAEQVALNLGVSVEININQKVATIIAFPRYLVLRKSKLTKLVLIPLSILSIRLALLI